MSDDFQKLTALRDEWLATQPLSVENRDRLWKKLRLEWNYHSNHIEGNTLTYGETLGQARLWASAWRRVSASKGEAPPIIA